MLATGIRAAATAIQAFLAGLTMGLLIDPVNRRTSSVAADLVSATAVAIDSSNTAVPALPVIDHVTGLNMTGSSSSASSPRW